MFMDISKIIGIIRSRGLRNLSYRLWYIAETKTGLLERKFPTVLQDVSLPSLSEWRSSDKYLFSGKDVLSIPKNRSDQLKLKAEKILDGQLCYFSGEWRNLGHDWNWHVNPETNFEYDHNQHWTHINELNPESGDVKFVWEASRFCFLYDIVRYDYHFDEDHSEFVVGKILDWIEKNPLNCGPNYKCSQEISLRVLNWLFALNFYKDSSALIEEKWNVIVRSIYWQIRHVYSNIGFSRHVVRNNHAITETLTLYLMGLMFPSMPDAKKWRRKGKRWFEKEIEYQIAEDGSFIQNSMNYHRVLVQLLTIAIAISRKNNDYFLKKTLDNAYKALNFLYQCQDETSGWLPNYGPNDGALFFPLSDADYRDYRPQLDALHFLLTGKSLYGKLMEDARWFTGTEAPYGNKPVLVRKDGIVAFSTSGYFLIREGGTLTFVRCGRWNGKGNCTDELHLDVWHNGVNVLLDGGSYSYNTTPEWVRYFSGTESHNTVMIGDIDQMLKGPRFVWMYPPTVINAAVRETKTQYIFEGEIEAFKQLGKGIRHKRTVVKEKGQSVWTVEDNVTKVGNLPIRQIWHVGSNSVELENGNAAKSEKKAWVSNYYGTKESCEQIEFAAQETITTRIKIKQ